MRMEETTKNRADRLQAFVTIIRYAHYTPTPVGSGAPWRSGTNPLLRDPRL